jgi:CDP-glucose 4,6-dehydratase
VLDCLNGYLTLTDALLGGTASGGEWNFGPGQESFVSVATVAELVQSLFDAQVGWVPDGGEHPHEAGLLALDATKAERELGWHNRLSFRESVEWTVAWERATRAGDDPRARTVEQIAAFERRD